MKLITSLVLLSLSQGSASAEGLARTPGAPPLSGGSTSPIKFSTNVETSSAPVDISSDGAEVFQLQHLTIFRGNVEVLKDDARMRTPELRVYSKPKDSVESPGKGEPISQSMGSVDHMDASGPFYYVTPTDNARSDYMHYDAPTDTITLVGNVVLVQGKNVAKGERLVMNRKTGVNDLTASEAGAPHGRIRAILYSQQPSSPDKQTAK
ncbi:MAG: LptA/OstA family protein [Caulobacteraceae bacterium]